jgi:hypothetical protein
MLEQLMKQIQQGGTTSVPALARQLSVSETLVEQMLAELTRLGYLRPLESCSPEACTGCPQNTSCGTRRPVQTWVVVKEIAR